MRKRKEKCEKKCEKRVAREKRIARFLRVAFGDNDFGRCVHDALFRLWIYVEENNSDVEMPKAFDTLRKNHVVLPAVVRLIDAEQSALSVEMITRGLCEGKKRIHLEEIVTPPSRVLNIRVSFHDTVDFSKRKDGECAVLNLSTGNVIIL